MSLAIACGSGGYRTVFIHGVLSALEAAGLRGKAYGGTSASTLATASAAIGESRQIGVDYWQYALALKASVQNGMSDVSHITIAEQTPKLLPRLFASDAPRFVIPVSAVITPEGAEVTQSSQARKLGRQLVISAARRQPHEWVGQNLRLHLYDTAAEGELRLTAANFEEVAYATCRMMHAWDIPATISGKPYVDASYLCSIPAVELAELGYSDVVAITADPPGMLYCDVFGTRELPAEINGTRIHVIMPEIDPAQLGADFTDATPEGLLAAYQHGEAMGQKFLAKGSL